MLPLKSAPAISCNTERTVFLYWYYSEIPDLVEISISNEQINIIIYISPLTKANTYEKVL